MVKDIKIIDKNNIEINPDLNNKLVLIPVNGKQEFITTEQARVLLNIIKGQLTILEAEKVVRRTGDGKHKIHSHSKTGCSIGGTG